MQVNEGLAWGDSDVVAHFATDGWSDAGEAVALGYADEWSRGDVLDIGIGGGRTTGLLAPEARSYIGIDLSEGMLSLARQRFPGADLRQGNARDLAGLPEGHFDLVMFSYNGLDALDHTARASALESMARVTRPDGRVLFSSLNLDGVSYDERPWWVAGGLTNPRVRYHLLHAVRHPTTVARSLRNYRRTRRLDVDGAGWAMRPLRAHEFRFVVHFATMAETVAEARAAGLEVVAAYADDGAALEPTAERTGADYIHFICRRIPPA